MLGTLTLATLLVSSTGTAPQATADLGLVPWPKSLKRQGADIVIRSPKIVATSATALPAAKILARDIGAKTGVQASVGSAGSSSEGEIRLVLAPLPGANPESYRIDVRSGVTITSPTLRGLTWGGVTLVQALRKTSLDSIQVPSLSVEDAPSKPFRSAMIDVARRAHSIDVLKQCVEMCRLYKIPYLQLHLSDDQSFTFPSRAFPKINTQNQNGIPTYSLAELKDLVRFAEERGVTLIPEMDVPGHSATLVRTMPELFKIAGTQPYEHHATINFANEEVLKAVDTLIGEFCEVFTTSPYFHIGGDEADIRNAGQHPDFKRAFKQFGLPDNSQEEIYRRFLILANEMVKKRGKQMIVWEGFHRNPNSKFPIPKDILVMEFENAYYVPNELLEDGYTLINASWTPLYAVNRHVWPAQKVYEWDLSTFGKFSNLYETTGWFRVPSIDRIIGAQVCSWESPESFEVENLRRLIPPMSERTWNLDKGVPFATFEKRMKSTDGLLDRWVHSVEVAHGTLDARDPNGFDVPCFTKPLEVRLRTDKEGIIRYSLDGRPVTSASPAYSTPIRLDKTTTVRSAVFSPSGLRRGFETGKTFYHVPPKLPNLATGKKATSSSGTQGAQLPSLAVDDNLDLASSWWAGPWPQWLQVDLGGSYAIDRIEVFPYWDGSRYYQYTVSISEDGKGWKLVADRSSNTTPANSNGDEIRIPATKARYVKVDMTRGSANEGVHLVELRVWEAKPGK